MTIRDLANNTDWEPTSEGFRVGKSKIVWESAAYTKGGGGIIIARVCQANEKGGRPWLMGLRYKMRWVTGNEKVTLIQKK